MQNKKEKWLSDCCLEEVLIHSADEGTNNALCQGCGKPCTPFLVKSSTKQESIVNQLSTENFDWEKLADEKIIPMAFISQAYCAGKNHSDDSVVDRISDELMERIKSHCVPKEDYDTARIVAEEVHDELLCEREKMEKMAIEHAVIQSSLDQDKMLLEYKLKIAQEKLEKVREWIKKEDSYNVESPNFEELNQILNQPNQ